MISPEKMEKISIPLTLPVQRAGPFALLHAHLLMLLVVVFSFPKTLAALALLAGCSAAARPHPALGQSVAALCAEGNPTVASFRPVPAPTSGFACAFRSSTVELLEKFTKIHTNTLFN